MPATFAESLASSITSPCIIPGDNTPAQPCENAGRLFAQVARNRHELKVSPVLFIDCIGVKLREGKVTNRLIYVVLTEPSRASTKDRIVGSDGSQALASFFNRIEEPLSAPKTSTWSSAMASRAYPTSLRQSGPNGCSHVHRSLVS